MTSIPADRSTWAVAPRYVSKKGPKPLKGFALDVTMRFSTGVFLQDHNGEATMHFDTVEALCEFLTEQIKRNYAERVRPGAG